MESWYNWISILHMPMMKYTTGLKLSREHPGYETQNYHDFLVTAYMLEVKHVHKAWQNWALNVGIVTTAIWINNLMRVGLLKHVKGFCKGCVNARLSGVFYIPSPPGILNLVGTQIVLMAYFVLVCNSVWHFLLL